MPNHYEKWEKRKGFSLDEAANNDSVAVMLSVVKNSMVSQQHQ